MNAKVMKRVWWRAASAAPRPVDEAIRVEASSMRSPATAHHADYVGEGMWQVDYLRGGPVGPVTRSRALAAMRIAATVADCPDIDPDQLNGLWAAAIGMTAREAVGYALMNLDPTDPDTDTGIGNTVARDGGGA